MLREKIPPVFTSNVLVTPLFGALIFSAASCGGGLKKILGHPWLVFLGEASYGLYILHAPLESWCNKLWAKIHGQSPGPDQTYFCLYLVTAVLVSGFTFVLFETPARRKVASYLKSPLTKNAVTS